MCATELLLSNNTIDVIVANSLLDSFLHFCFSLLIPFVFLFRFSKTKKMPKTLDLSGVFGI